MFQEIDQKTLNEIENVVKDWLYSSEDYQGLRDRIYFFTEKTVNKALLQLQKEDEYTNSKFLG